VKSNLSLILLFSIAALLGLYLLGSLQSDYQNSGNIFPEKFLEQLNSIKLTRGSEEIVLSKSRDKIRFGLEKEILPGQWLVSKPSTAFPNIEALNKFLSSISRLKIQNQIDSDSKAEFGLVEPLAILEARSAGETHILKVGSTNAISKRRYAQIEDHKKVVLLDDAEVTSMLKLDLRDLRPLRIPTANVSRFAIEGRTNKAFSKKEGIFDLEGEKNPDPQAIAQYLDSILSLSALKTVDLSLANGPVQSKLILEWTDSKNSFHQTEVQIHSTEGENFLITLQNAEIAYEYGPEIQRLLNRKLETFLNRKLLSSIILEDFGGSCLDSGDLASNVGPVIPAKCKPRDLDSIQEIIRRVEVLDIERLPGRLMTPTKPECRLKLESSKVLFEIGAQVSGDQAQDVESPRFFVSDVGPDHYRGVISGLMAKEFCQAIEKLCSEARASCAG